MSSDGGGEDAGPGDGEKVGHGDIGGSAYSLSSGDGAGEGVGGFAWSVPFKYDDKTTLLTLPKTELFRPRFFEGESVIIWANCFNLCGKSPPKSDITEASTVTGGFTVEPAAFVICTTMFCITR